MTRERAGRLAELDETQRAAMQWAAHERQIERIRAALPQRVHVIQYERLASREHGADERRALSEFLGLPVGMSVPPDPEAPGRWRRELTAAQRRRIIREVAA